MTDDADEAAYLRGERARFRFFKRIEDRQAESFAQHQEQSRAVEMPAGESFAEGWAGSGQPE